MMPSFSIWVITFFNPFLSWILPHTKMRETTVNICCFCCPALSDNHILIFFSVHLLLLDWNPSPNTVWFRPGNLEYSICLATSIVKEQIHNLSWACEMEDDFTLISGKDIPTLSCEAWNYIRTGDPAIILLPLGIKNVKARQEMMEDTMSSNVKPLDFLVMGPNKFNFA